MPRYKNKNLKIGLFFIFLGIIFLFLISTLNLINNYFNKDLINKINGGLHFACMVFQVCGILICGTGKSKHLFFAGILLILSLVSQILIFTIDNRIVVIIFTLIAELAQLLIASQITQGCGEITKSEKIKSLAIITLIFGLGVAIFSIARSICEGFELNSLNIVIPFSTIIYVFDLGHLILYWILIAISYKTI